VVEVQHAGALTDQTRLLYTDPASKKEHFYTVRNRDVVKQMLARGMQELVGSTDAVEAWRTFFQPGDRVGIKVVPVGKPDSISSFELIHEIVAALAEAGVPAGNVLVCDRYRSDFTTAQYHENLPEGVHWECASADYDEAQLELDGQLPGKPAQDHVSGYDPEVFRELAFCQPEPHHDPLDDRRFRSHLCNIVTKKIDKLICLPVLKDHRSSGVTLALKNMSHGLSNNVCRSHIAFDPKQRPHDQGGTINQCGTFIPAIVSLPPLRKKAVLQILDGLVGTYEGGPGNWNRTFATWPRKSLFFATDPVAVDHIGWRIIDEKRAEEGWAPVGAMGLWGKRGKEEGVTTESFHMRQPEHIPIAATLGLGVFDLQEIKHQAITLG
jgi:hypothetical protein